MLTHFKKKYILPVVATGFLFVGTSFKDDFFEIAKQIEIFTELFKTVNMNYVDQTNPGEMMDKAIEMIKIITTEFQTGQIFKGKVVSIKEFGAFVEFAPGKEGMVHISKIAKERIDRVEDVLTLGDQVTVVCLGKDKMGRMSFSMKDVAQV